MTNAVADGCGAVAPAGPPAPSDAVQIQAVGYIVGVSNDPIEQPGDMDDADTANGENPFERDPDDPDTSDAADARSRLSEDDDRIGGPLG